MALGARPQRLADRVVLPRLVGLHLRDPFPRLPDPAGAEHLRHREGAVAHEPFTGLVARMEDLDGDERGLGLVGAAVPEHLPHLFGGGVQLDLVVVFLHAGERTTGQPKRARPRPEVAAVAVDQSRRPSSRRAFFCGRVLYAAAGFRLLSAFLQPDSDVPVTFCSQDTPGQLATRPFAVAAGKINCDAILLTEYSDILGYFSSAVLGLMGFVFVLWCVVNVIFNERIRKLSWVSAGCILFRGQRLQLYAAVHNDLSGGLHLHVVHSGSCCESVVPDLGGGLFIKKRNEFLLRRDIHRRGEDLFSWRWSAHFNSRIFRIGMWGEKPYFQ